MANITPQQLKDYTAFEVVSERSDALLADDIVEAELEIKRITGHDFSDAETYPTLPDEARIAYLKMAQFYALINQDESLTKGYQSEKMSDYSYTLADGTTIRKPDVFHLLQDHIQDKTNVGKRVTVRMRAL